MGVRAPKGGIICNISLMTKFDALMIILIKYEDQQGSLLTMVGVEKRGNDDNMVVSY